MLDPLTPPDIPRTTQEYKDFVELSHQLYNPCPIREPMLYRANLTILYLRSVNSALLAFKQAAEGDSPFHNDREYKAASKLLSFLPRVLDMIAATNEEFFESWERQQNEFAGPASPDNSSEHQ